MAVGVALGADGSAGPSPAPGGQGQRFGKTGESIVSQAHGKYFEATHRGNVYAAATTAGRAPGTALSTKTPPILLYNPVGSGKRLKIMKVTAAQAATGTLGSGTLNHCGFTINGPTASQANTIPVVGSGAAITPTNLDIGAANASVATVFEGGTLNANPISLYPFCELTESVGGTTAVSNNTITEDVDGNIVLEPGAGWCLNGIAAAGSSPLVHAGVVWEEVPIV